MIEPETRVVAESERAAAEAAIAARLGPNTPKPASGAAGNSPYSPETVVYIRAGADGAQVYCAPKKMTDTSPYARHPTETRKKSGTPVSLSVRMQPTRRNRQAGGLAWQRTQWRPHSKQSGCD